MIITVIGGDDMRSLRYKALSLDDGCCGGGIQCGCFCGSGQDRWFPNYFAHLNHNSWESCVDNCEVLPYCMGGCRDRASVELGDWKARFCRKDAVKQSMIAFTRFRRRKQLESAV